MVDIIVVPSSLNRLATGNVTGQVFLRGAAGDFPETGWSDFPVVILGWWIAGLADVVARREPSYQGLFMDGPFAFVVERGSGAAGRLAWGTHGEETTQGIINLDTFLRSAVAAGRLLAEVCHGRQWNNRDLENLERAIARSDV
jgi:hypothetical protein